MLARTAPEGIDLKKRITGLAIGVLRVEGTKVTSGLPMQQEVNGVPVGWLEILHGQVIPLRTQ